MRTSTKAQTAKSEKKNVLSSKSNKQCKPKFRELSANLGGAVTAHSRQHLNYHVDNTNVVHRKPSSRSNFSSLSVSRKQKQDSIQPKLKVGPVNSHYEQEANQIADQVMSTKSPEVSNEKKGGQEKSLIQRKLNSSNILQRKAENNSIDHDSQAYEKDNSSPYLSPMINQQILSLKGKGRPLSDEERHFFEPRFGYNFSDVRIHNGRQASKAADSIQAQAFTLNNDIFFSGDYYQPDSNRGKYLLAHELTHVVQQGGATRYASSQPMNSYGISTVHMKPAESMIIQRSPKNSNESLYSSLADSEKETDDSFSMIKSGLGKVSSAIRRFGEKAVIDSLKSMSLFAGKTKPVLEAIIKNPSKVIKNLIIASYLGFKKFENNFIAYFKEIIGDWLFSKLDVPLPTEYSPKSMFFFMTRVLGLTYDAVRQKVLRKIVMKNKKLEPYSEQILDYAENSLELPKKLYKNRKNLSALWDDNAFDLGGKIKTLINGDIKDQIFDAVMSWVKRSVIVEVIKKIGKLAAGPIGGIIEAATIAKNIVEIIFERLAQIKELTESVIGSIADIAAGKLEPAAEKINSALKNSLSLVINLLIKYLGLGRIAEKLKKRLEKFKAPIKKLVEKIADIAAGAILKLPIDKLIDRVSKWKKAALDKVESWKNLFKKSFKFITKDGGHHTLYFAKGKNKKPTLMVRSEEITLDDIIKNGRWGEIDINSGHVKKLNEYKSVAKSANNKVEDREKALTNIIKILKEYGPDNFNYPTGETEKKAILINWYKTKKSYATIEDKSGKSKSVTDKIEFLNEETYSVTGDARRILGKEKNLTFKAKPELGEKDKHFESFKKKLEKLKVFFPGKTPLLRQSDFLDKGYDIDHVRDEALGGPDANGNIWPVKSKTNRGSFKSTQTQPVQYRGNSCTLLEAVKTHFKEYNEFHVEKVPTKDHTGTQDAMKKDTAVKITWEKKPEQYATIKLNNKIYKMDDQEGPVFSNGFKLMRVDKEYYHNPTKFKKNDSGKEPEKKGNAEGLKKAIANEENIEIKDEDGNTLTPWSELREKFYEVDHIKDRKLGKDCPGNFWPMQASRNLAATANTKQFVAVQLKGEGPKIERLGNLVKSGLYLKIVEYKDTPTSPSGHSTSITNPVGGLVRKKQSKDS